MKNLRNGRFIQQSLLTLLWISVAVSLGTGMVGCSLTKAISPEESQATVAAMVTQTLGAVTVTVRPTTAILPTLVPPTDTPSPTDTPTLTPEPSLTPTPTQPVVIGCLMRYNSINIRQGPSESATRVGFVMKGECVQLTMRSEDNKYGKLDRGWVYVDRLELSSNLSMLPVGK